MDKLDTSQEPIFLFKRIKKLQYKKEVVSGSHLLLDVGDSSVKKMPVDDSQDKWSSYGGLSTYTEGGETFTEMLTSS